ncbi:hypothetical protein R3P38DRAFT_2807934 [Favolaschia claudopus]|uniref:Uncharacterized protein n=1 Tax=Favolaschia claudopus TaxID=2862362 RepID=A0AAV9ZIX2_9AGAR
MGGSVRQRSNSLRRTVHAAHEGVPKSQQSVKEHHGLSGRQRYPILGNERVWREEIGNGEDSGLIVWCVADLYLAQSTPTTTGSHAGNAREDGFRLGETRSSPIRRRAAQLRRGYSRMSSRIADGAKPMIYEVEDVEKEKQAAHELCFSLSPNNERRTRLTPDRRRLSVMSVSAYSRVSCRCEYLASSSSSNGSLVGTQSSSSLSGRVERREHKDIYWGSLLPLLSEPTPNGDEAVLER